MPTAPPDFVPVIRYMNLSKFINLLHSQTLWFASLDTFSDEYEGYAMLEKEAKASAAFETFRTWSLVSCWNKFITESFPLWKIYLGGDKIGVGIVSTVGGVKNSIISKEEKERIEGFQIEYVPIDYKEDITNHLILATIKYDFYSYEDEIRFTYRYGNNPKIAGKAIKINTDILINQIIMSPYIPDWAIDSLRDLCSKYNIDPNLLKSSMVKDTMLK